MTEQSAQKDSTILKPQGQGLKRKAKDGLDHRLAKLESEINELKSILYLNESFSPHKNVANGLGRIRTGDLRRLKTEDLGISDAFSLGEMTTRVASAPSCTV